MQIPESFQLHGQIINVEYVADLLNKSNSWGECRLRENAIKFQASTESVTLPTTMIEQTFCHELMHYMLEHAESKLSSDEKFVNLMGNLLHQALSTMTYPKK